MKSSGINSSQPFNHSSSGSSLQFIESSITLVMGYPANFLVMWLVAREKSDSSTSNIFIFNLAIIDAFLCVMSPICFYGFYMIGFVYFEPLMFFTTGIKNTTDNKIRVAVSMLVWGLMIAFATGRSLQFFVSNEIYIALILAAFIIMVYCNVSIMWSLRTLVLGKEKMYPMKKKALRIVQIYLGNIVFHYLPVVAFKPFIHKPYFPEFCDIEIIMFSIMYFSTITAPFLYISQIKQLPWLKNLLCICCQSPSPEGHNVST